jgi:hypothetical protein
MLTLMLAACSDGSINSDGSESGRNLGEVTPSALPEQVIVERLSDAEYATLSAEDKYAATNKVLCALYKGMAPDEFFDTNSGLATLTPLDSQNMLPQIEADLLVGINETTYRYRVQDKYEFGKYEEPIQYQLALLYEMPISRNYFEMWMAYHLTNTILFSPAVELSTVSYDDARTVFERLVRMIRQRSTIREIVNAHMISQENWRRFRSPEDNTREMMEIFLGRFDDAEVPLAAQACQNWSLERVKVNGKKVYQLVIGDEPNTTPVDLLGTTVVECREFYDAVSNHPDLIPTVVSNIVNLFFGDNPSVDKQSIINDIVEDNPETFNAIFMNLLFSKAFLVSVERPKAFEELFFSCADKIDWYAGSSFFKYLNRSRVGLWAANLNNTKQAAMTYKLGRPAAVPLDTLSFAYYHKAVRERLLIDQKNPKKATDSGWQESFLPLNLTGDDFIDYLFLAVLSRRASAQELSTLNDVFIRRRYDRDNRESHKARIVLDYLSRLSELYYTQPFE